MHVFKAVLTAVLPTYTSCYTREIGIYIFPTYHVIRNQFTVYRGVRHSKTFGIMHIKIQKSPTHFKFKLRKNHNIWTCYCWELISIC